MATRESTRRWRFWTLALLWLPAGVVATAVVRFGADGGPAAEPGMWLATVPMMAGSLAPVAPCGLPLALGCRRLWRLGYRRGAWTAGIELGAVTGCRVAGGGAARPCRDRRLCGGAQRAGVDRLVLAGAAGVNAADAGPAAQHGARAMGKRGGRRGLRIGGRQDGAVAKPRRVSAVRFMARSGCRGIFRA